MRSVMYVGVGINLEGVADSWWLPSRVTSIENAKEMLGTDSRTSNFEVIELVSEDNKARSMDLLQKLRDINWQQEVKERPRRLIEKIIAQSYVQGTKGAECTWLADLIQPMATEYADSKGYQLLDSVRGFGPYGCQAEHTVDGVLNVLIHRSYELGKKYTEKAAPVG